MADIVDLSAEALAAIGLLVVDRLSRSLDHGSDRTPGRAPDAGAPESWSPEHGTSVSTPIVRLVQPR